MRLTLQVNGQSRSVDVEPDTPLLWVLRDGLDLTGTKYGCGMGICGACTVHQGTRAVRACQITAREASGGSFTTIEGLGGSHPCQRAWLEEDVAQCGYCQPGMIMEAVALLQGPSPLQGVDEAMSSHICRCGTYDRIRKAIERARSLSSRTQR